MAQTSSISPANCVYDSEGTTAYYKTKWTDDSKYANAATSSRYYDAILNQYAFSSLSSVQNLRITGFIFTISGRKYSSSSKTPEIQLSFCNGFTADSSAHTNLSNVFTITPTNTTKSDYTYTSTSSDAGMITWMNAHLSDIISGTSVGVYVKYQQTQIYYVKLALVYETIVNYTITTAVSPTGSGSVTGGGTYANGTSVTLTATPASNYHFVQWNDGNTNASRTITVSGNATYTATFALDTYTVTAAVSPSGSGAVTGTGTYNHGATAVLYASPATGYQFVRWSDGVTTSFRSVTVSANTTYTAVFELKTYTIYLKDDSGNSLGSISVTHGQIPQVDGTPTKEPSGGATYTFREWNSEQDGSGTSYALNALPAATGNTTYYAQFDADYSLPEITSVRVAPNPANAGQGVVITVTFNNDGGTDEDMIYHVPMTISEDEETEELIVTTESDYTQIRNLVLSGAIVIADVDVFGFLTAYTPCRAKDNYVLLFSGMYKIGGSAPSFLQIQWSPLGLTVDLENVQTIEESPDAEGE